MNLAILVILGILLILLGFLIKKTIEKSHLGLIPDLDQVFNRNKITPGDIKSKKKIGDYYVYKIIEQVEDAGSLLIGEVKTVKTKDELKF